jgi:hypothetical protein
MPENENGNGRLWDAVRSLLQDVNNTSGATVDSVATALLRRDAGLLGDRSYSAFLVLVEAVMRRHNLLVGSGMGAGIKQLATSEQRAAAGLSLEGRSAADAEVAAALVLGASPGASADAGRRRPAPPAAAATLSLESLTAKAEEAREHERLAALLTPASARRARR